MYAGYLEEGDHCQQSGCMGNMQFPKAENCSCHISPPCSSCTGRELTCSACGWIDKSEPERFIPVAPGLSMLEHKPRPLDNTKVDFRNKSHSGCSMIKEGVYPDGMTADEVRKVVDGTFGGRFEQFGGGKFKFIAYTD